MFLFANRSRQIQFLLCNIFKVKHVEREEKTFVAEKGSPSIKSNCKGMHSDLSPHLHTPECNQLIDLLKNCHEENKFAKFIGACNTFDQQVVVCLRNERKENSRQNREQAQEKQRRVQERMRQIEREEKAGH